ncbi:SMI1/KNR4 family protein [Metabacillus endolithicus]|uniref:SMI1/KNR4 family protein n=1 Tax=Metabacillus endolithicus TaxID=1535204 RepID=A0ABW5BZ79_9BACI|nr:SMI1/KNR4 family protein [Metabacillus endolithicus]UPG65445.1 SMI1/KNR4 family protein [Metabacillus endolithicus]
MEIEFESSFNLLVSKDIEIFENSYGIILSDDYKEFLLRNNGGKPVKRRFKTSDGTVTSSIMLFLPLTKDTDLNLERFYQKYCINKIVPSNLIPIGIDPAESLICLTLGKQDQVYFCDMDYFEEDNELKDEYIKLISEDFTTFLSNLYNG